MNTKEKGNIAESIILAEFIKYGIQVSIPFGDNAKYDLIADFNGKLNRIQVKYCGQAVRNNSITCMCSSRADHIAQKSDHTYTVDEVDYMAFYIAEWNKICLIPLDKINGKASIQIRLEKTTNVVNQWIADDYSFDKYFGYVA